MPGSEHGSEHAPLARGSATDNTIRSALRFICKAAWVSPRFRSIKLQCEGMRLFLTSLHDEPASRHLQSSEQGMPRRACIVPACVVW